MNKESEIKFNQAVNEYLDKHKELKADIDKKLKIGNVECPDCGNKIFHEGGCVYCRLCGWSKCK